MQTGLELGEPFFTVEDYLKTEIGPPWFELIEGHLVQEPAPTSDHQSIVHEIQVALHHYFRSVPGGRVLPGPIDVFLGTDSVLQPDIAVVLQNRRSRISKRGIEGAPDLVIEVLSPSNRSQDQTSKRRIYQREGARGLWLVDPQDRTVECLHFTPDASGTGQRIWRQNELLEETLLPGFSVALTELFQHCSDDSASSTEATD